MQVAVLRVPIICPKCAQESLTEFSATDIAQALASGAAIRLFARCHNTAWTASGVEREQLREYFEATSLSFVMRPAQLLRGRCDPGR
jgi:hypothetical protein